MLTLATPVLSTGSLTVGQFVAAVVSRPNRTRYTDAEVRHIGERTVHWCGVFGVNHDIVFAQMAHETGWFRFTGDVQFGQHNFAGLGATGGVPGHSFPNIDAGCLAVVVHHMVYAAGPKEQWPEHLRQYASADPRYGAVLSTGNAGKIKTLTQYRNTWAVPGTTYPEGLLAAASFISTFPKEAEMSADDPRFMWVPDVSEYGYPKGNQRRGHPIELAIVHITDGFDSLGHLTGNNGSSAHYLSDRSFRPRIQMVPEAWAAWTAGHREYNERGINWEFEVRAHTPISDEMLRNAADTMRPRLLANNIPLVYLGRNAPLGTRGIIGHADVPDPDGSGWGGNGNHFDPGEFWDWNKFMGYLNESTVPPSVPTLPPTAPDPRGTPYWIPLPFLAEIERQDWMLTGICKSEAFLEDGKLVQYFERARLELQPDGTVTRGLVGTESLVARYPERKAA